MKIKFTIAIYLLFLVHVSGQIHDTIELQSIIRKLIHPRQHETFWNELYTIDQHFRGNLTNDSIDERNLILSCLYFNKFGFPDSKICGKHGKIATLIWAHSKYTSIMKFTFPIILKAYLLKVIARDELINYFISCIYIDEFDWNEAYKNKELKELIIILSLNTDESIDIGKLVSMLNAIHRFENGHKEIQGIWQLVTTKDTFQYNEFVIPRGGDDTKFQLFKHENGKDYLMWISYGEKPREIEYINKEKSKFKVKGYNGIEYYEITKNGDIIVHKHHNVTMYLKKVI